jgi:hypothetical protein
VTQQEILQEHVEVRIKRYLIRKSEYERALYNIVGSGVSPQEYDAICNKLVKEGIVTRTVGERGATTLHWAGHERLRSNGPWNKQS